MTDRILIALLLLPPASIGAFGAWLQHKGQKSCSAAQCPPGMEPSYVSAQCLCGAKPVITEDR